MVGSTVRYLSKLYKSYIPILVSHEAEPNQVCGLPSQHHPKLGLFLELIQIAGTRLSLTLREASKEKQLFLIKNSGKCVIIATPSAIVSGDLFSFCINSNASLGAKFIDLFISR